MQNYKNFLVDDPMTIRSQPVDYKDTPKVVETENNQYHFLNEGLISALPKDVVMKMAQERIAQLKVAGYDVSKSLENNHKPELATV
ncbi:MAG: hypothetical protein Ta2B_01850 [Termitinemataceae bacterium]|nr:MAG: hypothetical protein Ta2B_01850 [Termitinemataceae bacterium]